MTNLRQLVVVVGETQVLSPRVDVKLAAKNGGCHGAALYVPACTSGGTPNSTL